MKSPACLVLAFVSVLGAGCGNGGGSDAGQALPAPATSAAPAPTSSSPAATAPTGATPTARAATGPHIVLDGLTATLPTGYRIIQKARALLAAGVPKTVSFLTLSTVVAGDVTLTTRQAARRIEGVSGYLEEPAMRPDIVVDGVSMFHLEGKIASGIQAEVYGAQSTGYTVLTEFRWGTDTPLAEQRAVARSLLATVDIKPL